MVSVGLSGEVADVLGRSRAEKIADIIVELAMKEIALSYEMAISGAMRWPIGLRPEVVIIAKVYVR